MQTSQTEENLAKSINCVAQSNLIFTEENQKLLITELSRTLQTLTSKLVIIKKKKTIFVLHSKDWPFWQGFFFFFGFRWQTPLKTSQPCLQNCQQKASHLEILMMWISWDSGSKLRWSPFYLKFHVNSCLASTHVASAARPTGHCMFITFPSADIW